MIGILLAALALLAVLSAPRLVSNESLVARFERIEPSLRKLGPAAVALISILIAWWIWGDVSPVPVIYDESSYLLQADIFARGRWTVPTPPLPEFFEQPFVQIAPSVASKYPPGHALLLTLGTLVGFPTLVPLLLTGVAAALLFALVTRTCNAFVALFAWIFWISAPLVMRFQPSYFSEVTTSALLLGCWWALLRWRDTRARRWLLLLALAVGWGAITRPLTMLAFALPIGIVVVRDVARSRQWRDFALAFAIGVAVLSVLPLWSWRTTGDWKLWPQEKYRRDYFPFDNFGFTPDMTLPRRAASMSPVLTAGYRDYLEARQQQRFETLPQTLGLRVSKLAIGFFQGPRLILLPLAILGLFGAGALQFAAVSALILFAAYLPYPHWAGWNVYYLDIAPIVAALAAAGVWRAALFLSSAEQRAKLGVLAASLLFAALAVPAIDRARREHRSFSAFYTDFRRQIARLPSQPAILFVKYSPRVIDHVSVVYNFADLNNAPVWVVHDLGARNAELLRLAPGRTAHHFDEDKVVPRR
jgi:4-amino-4-deoxy-L-arabinose transferase-like glycosyltransferase